MYNNLNCWDGSSYTSLKYSHVKSAGPAKDSQVKYVSPGI